MTDLQLYILIVKSVHKNGINLKCPQFGKITGVVASSPSFIPLLCLGWAGTEKSWLAQGTLASHTWGLPHPEVARQCPLKLTKVRETVGGVKGFQGQCLLLRTEECVV